MTDSTLANVIAVETTGSDQSYQFSVRVESPDEGCGRYADWWEVVTEDGKLLYRRTLLHSHVDEQPFTRSGGSVPIAADQAVIVRAHMNPGGYGGGALIGKVESGFFPFEMDPDFAPGLENEPPLPPDCAF